MNKKLITLAVAGAFVAPAAAFAQASNVQIYGTAYLEYGYIKQGLGVNGGLNNVDVMGTPGSNLGFKGEESLGGGLSAWFQCESSLDFRGGGNQANITNNVQNSGILCGRNSAIGLKGSFGNIHAGNWDAPMKINNTMVMGTNETGIMGTSYLLYGSSASYIDQASPTNFERRVNNSINYATPTWNGLTANASMSSIGTLTNQALTVNAPVGKPRALGLGASYVNGPMTLVASWEQHTNFNALGTSTVKGTSDNGYALGGAYQFGPVKAGAIYVKRNFDGGCAAAGACGGDAAINTYGANLDWAIQGPHQLKLAYVKANSTSGQSGIGIIGNLVFNAGVGQTGGSLWEAEYIYNFSKRTRISFAYVNLSNDLNARYVLGGTGTSAVVTPNNNQNAFATSIKSTF